MSRTLAKWLVASGLAVSTLCASAADITVSAAASLTNAFKEIAQSFEAQHPPTKVLLNFGASGALLQQMAKGAPVDVFASADQETMDAAEKQGLVAAGERRNFVRNTLVLIAPSDAKLALQQLGDLRQAAVTRVALGNPASVPVGRYTQHALQAADLWTALTPKFIHAQTVRQALDYVARGEVDAGFVYATDAALMKDKVRVVLEVPLDQVISYPLARTTGAAGKDEAKRFVDFVLSGAGQSILGKYGFAKP